MSVRSKKSLLSFLLCASLVTVATSVSQSAEQWRRLQGPDGAAIQVLFSHDDYLFAAGYNCIFRSTDQGQSWKRVYFGKIDRFPSITSFTAIGETLFAGAEGEPIFRSTDNGLTWTQMEVPEDITAIFSGGIPIDITALAVSGSSLFAGTYDGVFLSTDGGRSWAQLGVNLRQQRRVLSLAVNGTDVLAGCDNGRIYLSPDLGRRWAIVNAWIDPPVQLPPVYLPIKQKS